MATIEVTPAGNQVYEVEVRDERGASTHQVTLPDPLLESIAGGELAAKDVVTAAMALVASEQDHQALDDAIDLGELAPRYEGFTDRVAALARQRREQGLETEPAGPGGPVGDERLLEEVRTEQAEGEASTPPDRP